MERTVRICEDLSEVSMEPGHAQQGAYSWRIEPDPADPSYGEWELVLLFTFRQDGQTSWLVALTMVDGRVAHETGLTTSEWPTAVAIANAIRALTENWIRPLSVEIDTL